MDKKKELTKKDFVKTKWRVTKEQSLILFRKAIELGFTKKIEGELSFFNIIWFYSPEHYATVYYDSRASEERINEEFESMEDHEERKFEDFFEEIKDKKLIIKESRKSVGDAVITNTKPFPIEIPKKMGKKLMGKKSRDAGQRFEKRVREDLEKKGWIVDKWTNNVSDFPESNIYLPSDEREDRKLVKAKPKFVYNPQLKRRIPMGMSSGFPDFIIFKPLDRITRHSAPWAFAATSDFPSHLNQDILGVESKMDGKLDKEEKEKSKWLLDNNIFSKILIAKKGTKRGQIVYNEFK